MAELPSTTPRPEAEAADAVSDDTPDQEDVSSGRGEILNQVGPTGMSPWGRKQMLEDLDEATPAELLSWAWHASPVSHEHSYIQLVGGCIHYDEQADGNISALISNIEKYVPDRGLARLPKLTTIDHEEEILDIGTRKNLYSNVGWQNVGTEVLLGPVAELLRDHGAGDIHPKRLADITSQYISSGDPSSVENLFSNAEPRTGGQGGRDRAEDTPAATCGDGPGANDHNITPRSWPDVSDIQIVAQRPYNGIYPVIGGWGARGPGSTTAPPDRLHSTAVKAHVDLMPEAEIQSLLEREPDGERVKYLDVPDPLYDDIIEWRPELEEYPSCMAIFQKVLLGYRRDEDWPGEKDCTGMPIPRDYVFGAFGFQRRNAYNRRYPARLLLEIYRRTIDEQFRVSDWNHKNEKARIVIGHGIPGDIIAATKHAKFSPTMNEDSRYLINGKQRSTSRRFTAELREERRQELREAEDPVIEPPESAKEIQDYLNGLDQKTFGHGGYGIFRPDQLAKGAEAAAELRKESRRDQANRKLVPMRTHPQPLYKFCDRFPRQKADPYNQAMNLPSEILRRMYTSRDYEKDLSKAHLASYVPVAKREGIDVPTLEKYLDANLRSETGLLHRGDLWHDLASYTDLDGPPGKQRTTVKKAYSLVYGKDEDNLWFTLWKEWQRLTGKRLDGTDKLKGLRDHPLMDELLATRSKLEAIITSRDGLKDANDRFIPLEAWDEVKDKENRWRGCMAYVNCSFEQEIMYPIFRLADEEMKRDGKTRFKVWLYQGDGVTVRIHRDYAHEPQIARLQKVVQARASELGVPTELEEDYTP